MDSLATTVLHSPIIRYQYTIRMRGLVSETTIEFCFLLTRSRSQMPIHVYHCVKSFSDTVMKKESSLALPYQLLGGPVLNMGGRIHAIFCHVATK